MTFIYSIWLWLAWHECVFLSCGKKKLFTLFIFFFFSQFDVYFCWRAVKSWLFRFDIVFPVRDFFPLQMSLSSWKLVWFEWSKKTYYYNLKMKWNEINRIKFYPIMKWIFVYDILEGLFWVENYENIFQATAM